MPADVKAELRDYGEPDIVRTQDETEVFSICANDAVDGIILQWNNLLRCSIGRERRVKNFLFRGTIGTIEEHLGVVVRLVNNATDLVWRGVDCDGHPVPGGKSRPGVKEMAIKPPTCILVPVERSLRS
jgi:hypothetical protein